MILDRIEHRLDELETETMEKALLFIAIASDQGVPLRITSGFRSLEAQAALYAQGRYEKAVVAAMRDRAGMQPLSLLEYRKKVTNAMAGHSWHNFGRAFDVVPMLRAQRLLPDWASKHWSILGECAKAVGLEWGGLWTKPDRPHFQNPKGSLSEMRREAGMEE